MTKLWLLASLVGSVLFVAAGGHFHAGLILVVGLTLLLGLCEPLTAK